MLYILCLLTDCKTCIFYCTAYNDTRHRSNVCCQLYVRISKRVHQSYVQICFIFRRSGIFRFMYKSSSVEVVSLGVVTLSMSSCCLLLSFSFLQPEVKVEPSEPLKEFINEHSSRCFSTVFAFLFCHSKTFLLPNEKCST